MIDHIRTSVRPGLAADAPRCRSIQRAPPRQSNSLTDVLGKFSTTIKPYATETCIRCSWMGPRRGHAGRHVAEMLAQPSPIAEGEPVGLAVERQLQVGPLTVGLSRHHRGSSSGHPRQIIWPWWRAAPDRSRMEARPDRNRHAIRGLRVSRSPRMYHTAVEISGSGQSAAADPGGSTRISGLRSLESAIAADRSGRQPLLVEPQAWSITAHSTI